MNDYWSGCEIHPIFKIKSSSRSEKSINLLKVGEAQLSLIARDTLILKVHLQCLFTFSFIKSKVNTNYLHFTAKMAFTIYFSLFPL